MTKQTYWVLALAAFLFLADRPLAVANPKLSIELNKTEELDRTSCVAVFVIRNDLAAALDRFSLELFIFDTGGIVVRKVLLDLAPLRNDTPTVVRFPLMNGPCDKIGSILVNDIPSCRSSDTGEDLNCLSALQVSSRDRIGLTN